jgi:alpha-aminoadipate carrier protein LysW
VASFRWLLSRPHPAGGVDFTPVYNTLDSGARGLSGADLEPLTEDGSVIRCPECSAEIDVDEDEVEEGEILSCPECESELEVSQIHPVHLNIISEDDDDDEEEEEEEIAENGDLPEDDEEDDEEEDEE